MAEEFLLVHRATGREFKVVGFDQAKGEITLVGEMNAPFTEKFDKETFKACGYDMTKRVIEEPTQHA